MGGHQRHHAQHSQQSHNGHHGHQSRQGHSPMGYALAEAESFADSDVPALSPLLTKTGDKAVTPSALAQIEVMGLTANALY